MDEDDEIGLARIERKLAEALRELAAGLGLRRRDLPHAEPILKKLGLWSWYDGRMYEHERPTENRRPTPANESWHPEHPTVPEAGGDEPTVERNLWDQKKR